jgi:DNA-binding protein HU-beta
MTKAELVASIAAKTGKTKIEAEQFIEAFQSVVKENISAGITIRGFGTFLLKDRAAKPARNIKTGETIQIPAHKAPLLKFAKEFKEEVR